MLHKGEFPEYIDPYTLRFKQLQLEERHSKAKEDQVIGLSQLKLFVIAAGVLQILVMIPSTWANDDIQKFTYILTDIIIASVALTIELVVHRFPTLKHFRSFTITTGGLFVVVHYSSRDSELPSIYLGATALLLLTILSCSTFASSWITATCAQLCGQIAVTITVIVVYYDKTVGLYLIATLLTFNIGLLFGPVVYREMEKFQKNLIFLGWQIDEELKNWKILIGSLPVGIFIVRDHEIKYSNKAARRLLKVAESPLEHEDNEDYIANDMLKTELKKVIKQQPPSQREGEEVPIDLYNELFGEHKAAATSNILNENYYYRPVNSPSVLLSVSVTRLSLGSESSQVIVLQDLSIYEQLDEEKAYRQYQRVFFAMITHELRNPLQGILGVLELLKGTQTDPDAHKQCSVGLNTGKLMLCLIQDILDLSQIEANKFTLNDESFFPNVAITECLEVMEFQFKKKGLELLKNNACMPDLEITNDKTRYKQIVFNLLGNALKFTQKGHVDVALVYDEENRILKTTVSDTGIGIKSEEQPTLFKMYGKMESHKKSNPHGVGFGLNICKRLSETMGGGITFHSEYGKGTEFTFTVQNKSAAAAPISMKRAEAETGAASATIVATESIAIEMVHTESALTKPCKKGKVLVVDDEYICGYVLQNLIKSFGYETEVAQSGKEAFEILKSNMRDMQNTSAPIRLVFVDINMPEWNGFETTQKMHQLCTELNVKAPKILGLTGDDPGDLKSAAKQAGMNEILTKPISKDRLVKCLYDSF